MLDRIRPIIQSKLSHLVSDRINKMNELVDKQNWKILKLSQVLERYNFYQELINDPAKKLKDVMMQEIKLNLKVVQKFPIREEPRPVETNQTVNQPPSSNMQVRDENVVIDAPVVDDNHLFAESRHNDADVDDLIDGVVGQNDNMFSSITHNQSEIENSNDRI